MSPRSSRSYQRSVGHRLWLSGLRWQRAVRTALRPLELTPTQFLVLDACVIEIDARSADTQADFPSQQRLAELVGAEKMTLQRMLPALEDRGLITRHPSEESSLAWAIEPSKQALALLEKARRVVRETSAELFAESDVDERALHDALAQMVEPPPAPRAPGRRRQS